MTKATSKVINGYAFYASVMKPQAKYQKQGSENPLDYEYKIDIQVTEEAYYEFFDFDMSKRTPKPRRFEKQVKDPISSEDFEKRYKQPPVIPANDDDECFIITLKTNAAYTDKVTKEVKYLSAPRVGIKNEETGKLTKLTALVGNGSEVAVQYQVAKHPKYGESAKLGTVRVDTLVPYGDDTSELGEFDDSFDDDQPVADFTGGNSDSQPERIEDGDEFGDQPEDDEEY